MPWKPYGTLCSKRIFATTFTMLVASMIHSSLEASSFDSSWHKARFLRAMSYQQFETADVSRQQSTLTDTDFVSAVCHGSVEDATRIGLEPSNVLRSIAREHARAGSPLRIVVDHTSVFQHVDEGEWEIQDDGVSSGNSKLCIIMADAIPGIGRLSIHVGQLGLSLVANAYGDGTIGS